MVKRTNAFFLGLILVYLAAEFGITILSVRNIEPGLISSLLLSQGIMFVPALIFLIVVRSDVAALVPLKKSGGLPSALQFFLRSVFHPL